MNETIALLFSLLRNEIFGTPLPKEVQEPTEDELAQLYQLARRHDLAHLVGDALYKNKWLPPNSPTGEKLQKAQVSALYRYARMERERFQLFQAFEANSIPFVPLKGLVIRPLYPQPYLRTSCDLDILVHPEDLDRAVAYLVTSLGYKTDGQKAAHDISLYSPSGIHLELHFSIRSTIDYLDTVLFRVWDYAIPCTEKGAEHKLTPAFFMFHQIAHMVSHFLNGGCGIRPLLDLKLLLGQMPFDETSLYVLCCEAGIDTFYEQVKTLAQVWFAEEPHSETTRRMEQYILCGGVYGTMENAVTVKHLQQGGQKQFLLFRIFMPYRQLAVQFPVLEKHKWLYPFMTVRRWLRLLSPARRKRAQHELKQSTTLSEEKKSAVASLLSELGLS